jgi:hypothetical protein
MTIAEAEAAVAAAVAASGKRQRPLPRELRGLALPDRDWRVTMPSYTLEAKTREQFMQRPASPNAPPALATAAPAAPALAPAPPAAPTEPTAAPPAAAIVTE